MLAIETLLLIASAVFLVTQVVIPTFMGRSILPMFQRKPSDERQLELAEQRRLEAERHLKIAKMKAEAVAVEKQATKIEESLYDD